MPHPELRPEPASDRASLSPSCRHTSKGPRPRLSSSGRQIAHFWNIFQVNHILSPNARCFQIVIIHENLQPPGTVPQATYLEMQDGTLRGNRQSTLQHAGNSTPRERDEHVSIEISCTFTAARRSLKPPVRIPKRAVVVDIKVFECLGLDCLPRNNYRIAFQTRTIREEVLQSDQDNKKGAALAAP